MLQVLLLEQVEQVVVEMVQEDFLQMEHLEQLIQVVVEVEDLINKVLETVMQAAQESSL
jgi:hypothetical protein